MKIRFQVPEQADPRREGGMQLPPQQARRPLVRWRWVVVALLALSPALYVVGYLLRGWLWIDAAGYVVFEEARVTAPLPGAVRAVHAASGQRVERGALLLELDNPEVRAELAALEAPPAIVAEDGAARAALERQIAAVGARLGAERAQAATMQALHAEGAATRGEVLAADGRVQAAAAELAALEGERARLRAAAAALRARRADEAARLAVLATRRRALRVEAPVSGTVDGPSVHPGDSVAAGDPLVVVRHGEPRVVGFVLGRALSLGAGDRVRIVLPDGSSVPGEVVGQAPSTLRLPEELSGSFDQRTPRLQISIAPVGLPPAARVHRLPVSVRILRFRL